MKKLMIGAVVLAAAGVAMAGPAFTLPAVIAEVDNAADAVVTVNVGATAGNVAGLVMYLGSAAPLEILDLKVDGEGTMFGSNTTGANIATFANGGSPTPQVAIASVTTSSGTVAGAGLPVAIAQVKVPAGTPFGDYAISTQLGDEWGGVASDWAGTPADAQATGVIRVVPEPVSALLLLAGIPLLRRRHA